MSREFKPGDVAYVRWLSGTRSNGGLGIKTRYGWMTTAGEVGDDNVYAANPRVLIDPEDRKGAERLARVLGASGAFTGLVKGNADAMQAALREFANPTPAKPDEPQGLGAVVEDADGALWISVTNRGAGDRWQPNNYRGDEHRLDYDDIAVVKVLSEGVTE